MIINLRHVAINVPDFNQAKNFYISLGGVHKSSDLESSPFIGHLLDLPDVRLQTCKLEFPDGWRLEIMNFSKHKSSLDKNAPITIFGIHHLAFTVKNIENSIRTIISNGGTMVSKPIPVPKSHSKHAVESLHAYCRDPFGNYLHLAEDL